MNVCEQKLRIYYEQYFPYEYVFSKIAITENREISFKLRDDRTLRYLTFPGIIELKNKLSQMAPLKFDLGAVYQEIPAKGSMNKIDYKELVFDIDLTDYNRDCCKDKSICKECFVIIKVSIKLLDYILIQEFGYKEIQYFFSGGRGLHCWVLDKSAMVLSNMERKSVTSYISTVMSSKLYSKCYLEIMKSYTTLTDTGEIFKKLFLNIDSNVSNDIKHLLKSPFCVHPDTKKICVSLYPESIDDVTLDSIPTLDEIIDNPELINKWIK